MAAQWYAAMIFTPATVPLTGRHLIEASAGTGKTYNIANLFLRMLLEPHPSQVDAQPLTVDQILVVTFTNAATDELRGRIRRKIEDALQRFRGGDSQDVFINDYVATRKPAECADICDRLYRALLLIDDAAIFTIHGFAARAIQAFLFETGALAEVEVVIGQNERQIQQCVDVERWLAIGDNQKTWVYLNSNGVNTRKYIKELNNLVRRHGIGIKKSTASVDEINRRYEEERDRLLAERVVLASQWVEIDTKGGKSYNQIRDNLVVEIGNDVSSANVTYLIKFCNDNFSMLKGYLAKPPGALQKINDITDIALLTGVSRQIYNIVENVFSFNKNEDGLKEKLTGAMQSALLDLVQQHPATLDLAMMQPDEVIQLINQNLDNPDLAGILRNVVTTQYPVCMVDEFQDTDPDQYRMFDRFYTGNANLGLYAIGDPKQSIYAFRGADVFAYLQVKANTPPQNVHTLNVNYRSTQGVMSCVNALFRESAVNNAAVNPVFVYPGIDYRDIESCEKPSTGKGESRGIYRLGDEPAQASLVFVGCETEYSTFNNLQHVYAADCAERIVALLQGEHAATIEKPGKERKALKPGDIAVLVSSFWEANAIKDALRERNLAAVYLAQKDSVFQRCVFAKDLLFVLRAMDDPYSKRSLKAAFATPLLRHFTADTSMLERIEVDEEYAVCVSQFSSYQSLWEQKGILSALQALLTTQNLVGVFARHADRDRMMTDFRHLGELLQQQHLLTGSRERLIDWYATQLSDDTDTDEEAKSLRLESDDDLVKIVTLHGCKGLEYPVVFIPFFFGFKDIQLDKNLPLYHAACEQGGGTTWQAVLDFESDKSAVTEQMRRERMAEDMRLLYVGVTRAIYQCYIGISRSHYKSEKNHLFPLSCWQHLLGIDDVSPIWSDIKAALQARMQNTPVAYATALSDITRFSPSVVGKQLIRELPQAHYPVSAWQITSYSALAYQKETPMTVGVKSDDDTAPVEAGDLEQQRAQFQQEEDLQWSADIRYCLQGSSTTGNCLHEVFEKLVLGSGDIGRDAIEQLLSTALHTHGLNTPEWPVPNDSTLDKQILLRQQAIAAWLHGVLQVPLYKNDVPSLHALFSAQQVLPELHFDFALGDDQVEPLLTTINHVLLDTCGASSGIVRHDHRNTIHGVMTGSIDLLFIHNKKVYVLDYKSNTLGKAPRFYDHATMTRAMQESRYDLQYLIYSVAAHRYMQQRLGSRYGFDNGEYSFGGVFYLFLRGMGLPEYPQHGVWFHRPDAQHIIALDNAFKGAVIGEVASHG